MTRDELKDYLNANEQACTDFCIYDLLECPDAEQFEEDKGYCIESMRIEISHLTMLIDRLQGLEFEDIE